MAELDEELVNIGYSYTMKTANLTAQEILKFFRFGGEKFYKLMLAADRGSQKMLNAVSGKNKTGIESAEIPSDEGTPSSGPNGGGPGGSDIDDVRIMSIDDMLKEGQKLESVDITDLEDKDKLMHMLCKYDIDCSIRCDNSTDPPTYHLFFKADDTSKLMDAVKDYANLDDRGNPVKEKITKEQNSPRKEVERLTKDQNRERGMKQIRKREIEH